MSSPFRRLGGLLTLHTHGPRLPADRFEYLQDCSSSGEICFVAAMRLSFATPVNMQHWKFILC